MCLFHIGIINCYIFSIRFLNINATKCFVGCPVFLLLLSPLLLRTLHSHHFVFKPLFYFCWVHSAYGPCSLSVLPPYKNQKSFFLLPDDFTKTPIKNNRYEYSYYILTTQHAKNEYYSFTLKYCRTNEYDCLFEGEDTIVKQQ